MKLPDIRGAKLLVCGLQGGGKTYKVKQIVKSQNLKVLVYSPHLHDFVEEPDNFIFYKAPMDSTGYIKGFKQFAKIAKELVLIGEIDGIIIDEFDMIFQSNFDMDDVFIDLTTNHRHFGKNGMFIIGITRRPQDVPTRFAGSCKYKIVFALDEDNAIKKFNAQYAGWGKMISELDYKQHKFYFKEIGRPPLLCSADDC